MKKIIIFIAVAVLLGGGALFYVFITERKISVDNKKVSAQTAPANAGSSPKPAAEFSENPLTGQKCARGNKRPMAVMFAVDTVARPLYGISQADIAVEMPALTNGITRLMALFSCEEPEEIGSIRSARHDFLPFARSFDAIYAHWGGSYLALNLLNKKVLDNLDALPNPHDAFYRRSDKLPPHNGFTSFARLSAVAEKLGYRSESQAASYPRIKDEAALSANQNIAISYPYPYNVDFAYDHKTNSYKRFRGNEREIDAGDQSLVEVKNVIVMTAESRQVNPDYNDVDVEGEGKLAAYRNGEVIKGKWKRAEEKYDPSSKEDNKYYFLDAEGREIGLVEGKIWISVVQPNQKVELTFK
ncbi:MAG TPA: DUF3048 domain-containing protein [Candidatus Paceibacterota bacterium]